MAITSTGLGC